MKKVNLEQRYIIELKHSIKFKTSMPGPLLSTFGNVFIKQSQLSSFMILS